MTKRRNTKKTNNQSGCLTILVVLIIISCFSCGGNHKKGQPESVSATSRPVTIEPVITESPIPVSRPVEYDALQKVFIAMNKDSTIEDLMSLIADYDLDYTSKDYNSTPDKTVFKLAYSPDIADQSRYADPGDYVQVAFDTEAETIMYAVYSKDNAFKTALYYNYGTYWDFREEDANNTYTGYYYYAPGDTQGGIVMEYDNGHKRETGYYKCSDAEEAIKNAISE